MQPTHRGNMEVKLGKFELEPPYDILYNKGYIVVNPEGRRNVILYNSKKDRSTTSYARYLVAVSLNRVLSKNEHIDHIDGDKTNDVLENLQILTQAENNRKTHLKNAIFLICPVCKTKFNRTRTELRGRLHKVESNTICCSRSCGSKYSHINGDF